MLTAIATSIGAFIAVLTFFDLHQPCLKKGGIIENQGKKPIVITHIESSSGTLGNRNIDGNYGFSYRDTGKSKVDVEKMLLNGDCLESLPEVVFINGEPYNTRIELKRKNWSLFGVSHWYVKIIPTTKTRTS